MRYGKADLIANSPITEKHVATGMSVAGLCAATIQYSDNAAANVLLKLLGGPAEVTAFARRIGDQAFRLDRTEPELNTSIPGDLRDTTTPAAMSDSVQRLVLGDALGAGQRDQLKTWLLGNTTSADRFVAGVPAGWKVADKTGAGSYGSNNDVGVLWPPAGAPLVLSVYLTFRAEGCEGAQRRGGVGHAHRGGRAVARARRQPGLVEARGGLARATRPILRCAPARSSAPRSRTGPRRS
jgi:beta-lactamase class A